MGSVSISLTVFAADDNGTVHLGGDDTASQDTATDGDETSEGALLVCRILLAINPVPDRLACLQKYLWSFSRDRGESRRRFLLQVRIDTRPSNSCSSVFKPRSTMASVWRAFSAPV